MSESGRPVWFGHACDAVAWRLTLYENGTMEHDDTVKAIVTAVAQIATAEWRDALAPRGVISTEDGRL